MNLEDSIKKLSKVIHSSKSLVVMTGAGISSESGVPTFRGEGGFWKGRSAMELASPEGFENNPELVWQWYEERRTKLKDIKPNPAHFALAELEKRCARFTLITQNVDRLHHQAGSKNILELHGTIWKNVCLSCPFEEDHPEEKRPTSHKCPKCGGWLRPGVVWFGEMLPEDTLSKAYRASENCDVFLVVGTSGVVYPAAGLSEIAKRSGAYTALVNLEKTNANVDLVLLGKAGNLLPKIFSAEV